MVTEDAGSARDLAWLCDMGGSVPLFCPWVTGVVEGSLMAGYH